MERFVIQESSGIELDRLSLEHSALARQQYEALQKSPYINMTCQDAEAYDQRRLRIGEICQLLARFRSKL
jgi:hypothetical protein